MECGWLRIYERLKALGQLDNYRTLRAARDHRKDRGGGVRRLVLKDMAESQESGNE
mgnify:FL=1